MPPPPLLALQDITHSYGGRPLLRDANLLIYPRERISLIGRNGTGKSTLMKMAAGYLIPEYGTRFVQPGTHFTYIPQEPDFGSAATAFDFLDGVYCRMHGVDHAPVYKIELALAEVGLTADLTIANLSGGQKRRLDLARVVLEEPDILLLDEPTNHLDLPSIDWLEQFIRNFAGAVVIISHDRTFLRNLTNSSLWIYHGQVRRFDAGFTEFEPWSEAIMEQEQSRAEKLDKLIAEETIWSVQGISARRKRNQGRLRRLQDMRQQKAGAIKRQTNLSMDIETGDESGWLVCEALHVHKSYGEKKVVQDFTARIKRGDKIGIIGANGAGKSTLIKIITGELSPDRGKIRLGSNLRLVQFDQGKTDLDPNQSVRDALCDKAGDFIEVKGKPRHYIGYLKEFLFDERQAQSIVKTLSGGERTRLLLAKTLAKSANVLVLDEPTNDLDMDTLDLLQDVLADFEGTLLLVSHDRDFLDRIVTSTLVFGEDGKITEYAGGYSDYRAQLALAAEEENAKNERRKAANHNKSAPPANDGGKADVPSKLSYQQQRALNLLPEKLEKLAAEIHDLENQLSDPDLYARDHGAFTKITTALNHARAELHTAEEQWLELEMLRDMIEKNRK